MQKFFSGVQRKEKEEEAPLDLLGSPENPTGGQTLSAFAHLSEDKQMKVNVGNITTTSGTYSFCVGTHDLSQPGNGK